MMRPTVGVAAQSRPKFVAHNCTCSVQSVCNTVLGDYVPPSGKNCCDIIVSDLV